MAASKNNQAKAQQRKQITADAVELSASERRQRAMALRASSQRGDFLAAAKEYLAIEEPTARDLADAAYCLWSGRQWKKAERAAAAAVELEANGWSLCVAGYAVVRDRAWDKLEDDEEKALAYFEAAIELPGCSEYAYTFVANRTPADSRRGLKRKLDVLRRGFLAVQSAVASRLAYASLLIEHRGEPQEVLDTLAPVLESDNTPLDALWFGAVAAHRLNSPRAAVEYVQQLIAKCDEPIPASVRALEALLLGEIGREDEALAAWNAVIGDGSEFSRVVGTFGRAKVRLDTGSADAALEEVLPVLSICFASPVQFGHWSAERVGNVSVPPAPAAVVAEVAARLSIFEPPSGIDERVAGELAYIAVVTDKVTAARALGLDCPEAEDLLWDTACSLARDPSYDHELARYHEVRGRWALAVRHDLLRWIDDAEDYASIGGPGFASVAAATIRVPWSELTTEERLSIHQEVMEVARTLSRSDIASGVLATFYDSGWHDSLFDAGLLEASADASRTVLGHALAEAREIAAMGYGDHRNQRLAEAEARYRKAIEWGVDSGAPYHNLAQILKSRGEALDAQKLLAECEKLWTIVDVDPNRELDEFGLCPILTSDEGAALARESAKALEGAGRYQEAAEAFRGIEKASDDDLMDAAWCLGQVGGWAGAVQVLAPLVQRGGNAWAMCYTALARAEGGRWSQLSPDTLRSARALLARATETADCPVWGYTSLASIHLTLTEVPFGRDRAHRVLEAAIERFPYAASPRLIRADMLLGTGRRRHPAYTEALEVVLPIADGNFPDPKACWIAVRCFRALDRADEALEYIQRIVPQGTSNSYNDGAGIVRAKGDVLFELGRTDDALECYDELTQSVDPAVRVAGWLSRAYAHFEDGATDLALVEVQQALELWYSQDEFVDIGALEASTEDCYLGEYGGDELGAICESFLRPGERHRLDDLTYGRLSWFLFLNTGILSSEMHEKRFGPHGIELAQDAIWFAPDRRYSERVFSSFLAAGNPAEALRHHLLDALWQHERSVEYDYYADTRLAAKLSELITPQRRLAHAVVMEVVRGHLSSESASSVLLPFYSQLWGKVLCDAELWDAAFELTQALVTALSDHPSALFDAAYAASQFGRSDDAERLYRLALEHQPESAASLNNLGVLVEKKGDHEEALRLYERAAAVDPSTPLYQRNATNQRAVVANRRTEVARRETFLNSAVDRWSSLDHYKRKLAAALSVIDRFDDWKHLAQLTMIEAKYLPGHWQKLVEAGIILEENDGSWDLNPRILPLIERERAHAVVTRVIRADAEIGYKPIFNSKLEYSIYDILLGLFPNQLVFPNMGLQGIFQYDYMKARLGKEDFRYFLMASVDFSIVSTTTYLPIVAFEVDSSWHDTEHQQERDRRKDSIFQLGGVPLLRLRRYGDPTREATRFQIIAGINELRDQLIVTDAKASALLADLNFDNFRYSGRVPE